jgi:hypothetical protein
MVDWQGRKPCSSRFHCVETGRAEAAAQGEEFFGLTTELCSTCQKYHPDSPQLYKRTKFF